MRTITQIIVHCSATPPSMDIGAADIRRWHTDPPPDGRGWRDIGYHYVIRRDGTVEPGRDLDGDGNVDEEIGAHAAGHNAHSIGICLAGGINESFWPDSNFTARQYLALMALIQRLRRDWPTITSVIGHRDVNTGKNCPSFDVTAFVSEMPE